MYNLQKSLNSIFPPFRDWNVVAQCPLRTRFLYILSALTIIFFRGQILGEGMCQRSAGRVVWSRDDFRGHAAVHTIAKCFWVKAITSLISVQRFLSGNFNVLSECKEILAPAFLCVWPNFPGFFLLLSGLCGFWKTIVRAYCPNQSFSITCDIRYFFEICPKWIREGSIELCPRLEMTQLHGASLIWYKPCSRTNPNRIVSSDGLFPFGGNWASADYRFLRRNAEAQDWETMNSSSRRTGVLPHPVPPVQILDAGLYILFLTPRQKQITFIRQGLMHFMVFISVDDNTRQIFFIRRHIMMRGWSGSRIP